MNLIETMAAIGIMSAFLAVACGIIVPAVRVVDAARSGFELARSISFLDESFRSECERASPDVDRWKRSVSVVAGLSSCEVTPCRVNGRVHAMKAVCVVGPNRIEILAECGDE
jgi:hypothetical protein